ncbi:MAG: hypothetical protein H6553_03320 [Chitinophagales bacterium]|nr:hypothetical protein [Chitinophagales bacterium]
MCIHLKPIEDYLKSIGYLEVYRGQVWSENCREWIYFDAVLNIAELQEKFKLNKTIVVHDYQDVKVGSELGILCTKCFDGIMGVHPNASYAK